MANIASLMIPMDMLTKIFISHLHTDHWGDLASLWAGGWTSGRSGPLEVWGPSGAREDMGTKYAIDGFMPIGITQLEVQRPCYNALFSCCNLNCPERCLKRLRTLATENGKTP